MKLVPIDLSHDASYSNVMIGVLVVNFIAEMVGQLLFVCQGKLPQKEGNGLE